jgi:hypothetical protein
MCELDGECEQLRIMLEYRKNDPHKTANIQQKLICISGISNTCKTHKEGCLAKNILAKLRLEIEAMPFKEEHYVSADEE